MKGIFPEISREYVAKGSALLVNITNDAWFGDSSAPYQHLSMTVFRAVENRVPLVRSANTGITAIIDSRGHVRGMTGLFREALLTGDGEAWQRKELLYKIRRHLCVGVHFAGHSDQWLCHPQEMFTALPGLIAVSGWQPFYVAARLDRCY